MTSEDLPLITNLEEILKTKKERIEWLKDCVDRIQEFGLSPVGSLSLEDQQKYAKIGIYNLMLDTSFVTKAYLKKEHIE